MAMNPTQTETPNPESDKAPANAEARSSNVDWMRRNLIVPGLLAAAWAASPFIPNRTPESNSIAGIGANKDNFARAGAEPDPKAQQADDPAEVSEHLSNLRLKLMAMSDGYGEFRLSTKERAVLSRALELAEQDPPLESFAEIKRKIEVPARALFQRYAVIELKEAFSESRVKISGRSVTLGQGIAAIRFELGDCGDIRTIAIDGKPTAHIECRLHAGGSVELVDRLKRDILPFTIKQKCDAITVVRADSAMMLWHPGAAPERETMYLASPDSILKRTKAYRDDAVDRYKEHAEKTEAAVEKTEERIEALRNKFPGLVDDIAALEGGVRLAAVIHSRKFPAKEIVALEEVSRLLAELRTLEIEGGVIGFENRSQEWVGVAGELDTKKVRTVEFAQDGDGYVVAPLDELGRPEKFSLVVGGVVTMEGTRDRVVAELSEEGLLGLGATSLFEVDRLFLPALIEAANEAKDAKAREAATLNLVSYARAYDPTVLTQIKDVDAARERIVKLCKESDDSSFETAQLLTLFGEKGCRNLCEMLDAPSPATRHKAIAAIMAERVDTPLAEKFPTLIAEGLKSEIPEHHAVRALSLMAADKGVPLAIQCLERCHGPNNKAMTPELLRGIDIDIGRMLKDWATQGNNPEAQRFLFKEAIRGQLTAQGRCLAEQCVAYLKNEDRPTYTKLSAEMLKLVKSKEISDEQWRTWNRCQMFDIDIASRFSPDTLKKILDDRTPRAGDKRPILIVVASKSDDNTVFLYAGEFVEKFIENGFRIDWRESWTGDGVVDQLAASRKLSGRAARLGCLMGHGSQHGVEYGFGSDVDQQMFGYAQQERFVRARAERAFETNCQIIMLGCDNAHGKRHAFNVTNFIRTLVPQAKAGGIWGATKPYERAIPKFRGRGQFDSVEYEYDKKRVPSYRSQLYRPGLLAT